MVATGVAFACSSQFAWLLLVAFVGTVNPSAGNVSIFVPMEHALLAGIAPAARRTRLFAIYGLTGAIAASLGSLAAGTPELLGRAGWSRLDALQAMFLLYAALGLAGGACYRMIPAAVEPEAAERGFALGPSRRIVLRLAALFSLDAFAGGFAVQSLLALWLFNTMVYTHIPSSLCLIGAAFVPDLPAALALLLLRAALSQMDVPTRSSYVMALVRPAERAAAASVTSVPRGLAAAASPALAGALLAAGYSAWPLAICFALFAASSRRRKPGPDERKRRHAARQRDRRRGLEHGPFRQVRAIQAPAGGRAVRAQQ
jgi:hypothetical protein